MRQYRSLETNLEHAEMEIPLSLWTTASAQVILDFCYCSEWVSIQRVEHLESETAPVDDNGKVVPRGWRERCVEQYGAIVRTDAECRGVGRGTGRRRIERCPYKKQAPQHTPSVSELFGLAIPGCGIPVWRSKT
jgi:hypothetical protein